MSNLSPDPKHTPVPTETLQMPGLPLDVAGGIRSAAAMRPVPVATAVGVLSYVPASKRLQAVDS